MQAHGILAETSIASAGLMTQVYQISEYKSKALLYPPIRLTLVLGEEFVDLAVDPDVTFADRFFEANALEGSAAAEGDIGLTRGETSISEVDDHTIKGLALTLVDGDGPGNFQGNLLESTSTFLR